MPDSTPQPGSGDRVVAILGAGQLGRMLALSGVPLGVRFRFLDPESHAPAGAVGELIQAPYDDRTALAALIDGTEAVTFEFENVPARVLEFIGEQVRDHGGQPPAPPADALATAQDRLEEKTLFRRLNIPTPRFAKVGSREDLEGAISELGTPLVVKTRRGGYDGKGQFVLRDANQAGDCWELLGPAVARGGLIAEAFVPFVRELSIIATRARTGDIRCYPLVENRHAGGILQRSVAPAPGIGADLQTRAETHVRRLMEALDYVGTIALELFEVKDSGEGWIIANEFAPRVHNSGHWTIEGSRTSQFENHIRAILGLPLGPTDMKPGVDRAVMLNLVGAAPSSEQILAIAPDAHPHLYGKAPRPGRKVGHITLLDPEEETVTHLESLVPAAGAGAVV